MYDDKYVNNINLILSRILSKATIWLLRKQFFIYINKTLSNT